MTALDLSRYLKNFKYQILLLACATISELPSAMSTISLSLSLFTLYVSLILSQPLSNALSPKHYFLKSLSMFIPYTLTLNNLSYKIVSTLQTSCYKVEEW